MFTSSWVALTDLSNCGTNRDVYALLAPHTIPPFHQLAQTHIPMKDLPLSSSRVFSTVSTRGKGPTQQLDLLRRSPAFPQQQGRPAASARRGFWWGDRHTPTDPSHCTIATGLGSAALAAVLKIHRCSRSMERCGTSHLPCWRDK